MKRSISIILGIAILIMAILAFVFLRKKEKPEAQEEKREALTVSTTKVKLTDLPYNIEATGILNAKQQIEIYSEVQGVLQQTNTPFKVGNTYRKGQIIFTINSAEYRAQVKSNRSNLMNQIASMMPDMELDYPDAFTKWQDYLNSFDVTKTTQPLPDTTTDQEKLFVSGKNIYQTYYSVKNLEERLSKYYITAPFTGTVTEVLVNPGALVRSGQKIGEFIDTSVFELELAVPANENQFLKKGKIVELSTLNKVHIYNGIITRISSKIDQQTQTLKMFVELKDTSLKDGQYLKAHIKGASQKNVFKINAEWLKENNQVFIVEDNVLKLHKVIPINFTENIIIVTGLENGMQLVTQTIANAYPGVKVKTKPNN